MRTDNPQFGWVAAGMCRRHMGSCARASSTESVPHPYTLCNRNLEVWVTSSPRGSSFRGKLFLGRELPAPLPVECADTYCSLEGPVVSSVYLIDSALKLVETFQSSERCRSPAIRVSPYDRHCRSIPAHTVECVKVSTFLHEKLHKLVESWQHSRMLPYLCSKCVFSSLGCLVTVIQKSSPYPAHQSESSLMSINVTLSPLASAELAELSPYLALYSASIPHPESSEIKSNFVYARFILFADVSSQGPERVAVNHLVAPRKSLTSPPLIFHGFITTRFYLIELYRQFNADTARIGAPCPRPAFDDRRARGRVLAQGFEPPPPPAPRSYPAAAASTPLTRHRAAVPRKFYL
ncbi:hypothetical protein EVAR_55825_1 [Eumeta japonica]|uniref:Uncharacterized protein n=1 Tax=Eumeta variegata TaxID=151549 RepID=A0A4C1Z9H3_EUMVA|nr:hypothetical protein EVAR_55825_1 [Eumeta japonica]